MANFKVTIEGLEFFKEQLKGDNTLKSAIPDISIAIKQLHTVMESRVRTLFSAKDSLSSVMIGNTVKPVDIGKTFLRYSLQYKYKEIPLIEYPHQESSISVPEQRFTRWVQGTFGMITVNKAIKTESFIRKGSPKVPRRVKGSPIKGFLLNGNIVSRTKMKTWEQYPTRNSQGKRVKLQTLYGPSLSQLASKVYDKDKQVQEQLLKVDDQIIAAMTRWYK